MRMLALHEVYVSVCAGRGWGGGSIAAGKGMLHTSKAKATLPFNHIGSFSFPCSKPHTLHVVHHDTY